MVKPRLADVLGFAVDDWRDLSLAMQGHLDFLVCDSAGAPLVAVELDDSSHAEEKRVWRDGRVENWCLEAGLPLARVRCRNSYSSSQIRWTLRMAREKGISRC